MNLLKHYPKINEEMNLIEKKLYESTRSRHPVIEETVKELLEAGGKRLRPLLLLLSAQIGQYDSEKVISLAAAVEILHMATLVHDDIIDEAFLRRGTPTVQSKWGKDIAVFTGDYLLCKAFLLVPDDYDNKGLIKLTRSMKMICEGEIQQYSSRYSTDVTILGYLKRIAAKTAALFSLSCYIGASQANCSRKIVNALAKYGMSMGMAFQMTDDLLDFTGKMDETGKPVNHDFTQGIYTLPIIYTLHNKRFGSRIKELLAKEQHSEDDNKEITRLVLQSGGVDYTKKLAGRYLKRAKRSLDIVPPGRSKEIMSSILDLLINRTI